MALAAYVRRTYHLEPQREVRDIPQVAGIVQSLPEGIKANVRRAETSAGN